MDEFFGIIIIACLFALAVGTVNNLMFQTPDSRIITQCKEQGYLNINQTIITCSIEKEIKK